MRPPIIAGVILATLGAFVLLRGASFASQRDVVSVGDVKITADHQQSVPPWAGGAALVLGIALVATGIRKPA